MTSTDIREALRAVADSAVAAAPDRLAVQRLVRQERRRRIGGRLLAGVAAAAVIAVGATALGALPGDRPTAPMVTPEVAGVTDLEAPVYVVLDMRLVAVDPRGNSHDLGRAEEVVGSTSEYVWYVDSESALVRRDLSTGDEGPGGWRWSEPTQVAAPVQSAQLSADGRWLGWVDLRERLHVEDLKAGTRSDPVQLEGSGYLADLAQGTGRPLVFDDRGLLLLGSGSPMPIPREGDGWTEVTATRDLAAVVEEAHTNIVELEDGYPVVDTVPGHGRLSPYGDALAAVDDDQAYLWLVDGDGPQRLDVPGVASQVTWGDDDTVLVASVLDRTVAVYACDVATAGEPCAALDLGEARSVTLAR